VRWEEERSSLAQSHTKGLAYYRLIVWDLPGWPNQFCADCVQLPRRLANLSYEYE